MCLSPIILPTGDVVACRECRLCKERYINDWAGRCIAESKHSDGSLKIELTYGRDDNFQENHMRACVLTYSDVQDFFKRVRKKYKIRYIVSGEYGSTNLRAHWHLILFFKGDMPDLKNEKEFKWIRNGNRGADYEWTMWPHGHVHVEDVHINSARYLTKYITKDTTDDMAQAHFSVSKKPPLGDTFFRKLAEKYVEQGLAPQDALYTLPGITLKDGTLRKFYMSKTVKRNFLEYFISYWLTNRRGDPYGMSEIVDEHMDEYAAEEMENIKAQEALKKYGETKTFSENVKRISEKYGEITHWHLYGEQIFRISTGYYVTKKDWHKTIGTEFQWPEKYKRKTSGTD